MKVNGKVEMKIDYIWLTDITISILFRLNYNSHILHEKD